jgi:hypothetical protein
MLTNVTIILNLYLISASTYKCYSNLSSCNFPGLSKMLHWKLIVIISKVLFWKCLWNDNTHTCIHIIFNPWGPGLEEVLDICYVPPEATEWGDLSDETGKIEAPRHTMWGTINIPPCSKALSAEHRPKFCSPSPVMITSPHEWKILERDETKQIINLLHVVCYCSWFHMQQFYTILIRGRRSWCYRRFYSIVCRQHSVKFTVVYRCSLPQQLFDMLNAVWYCSHHTDFASLWIVPFTWFRNRAQWVWPVNRGYLLLLDIWPYLWYTQWVWPVNRGYLLLLDTWPYLWYTQV